MKRHGLRGLLLGISLALLLSGGVALAQNVELFLLLGKPCVECWAGQGEPTQDRYLQPFSMGGWNARYLFCFQIRVDGELLEAPYCGTPPEVESVQETLSFPCEWSDEMVPVSVLGGEVNVANGDPGPLGHWVFRIWQETAQGVEIDSAMAGFLVAETCEVEEEFVPEPGTILLLGSGLAGLAGYASLRWRNKE